MAKTLYRNSILIQKLQSNLISNSITVNDLSHSYEINELHASGKHEQQFIA